MGKKECVYVIHAEGTPYYKVGKTTDITARFAAIQSLSPVALDLLTVHYSREAHLIEQVLHKCLAKSRHHGEWFELSDNDLDLLLSDTEDLLLWFEERISVLYGG